MSRKRFVWRSGLALTLAVVVLASAGTVPPGHPASAADNGPPPANTISLTNDLGAFYQDVLAEWKKQGVKPASQSVAIPAANVSASSHPELAVTGSYESKSNVLVWKSDRDNWIEYQVDAPQDGLYEVEVSYHPYDDPNSTSASASRKPANLSLQIDGAYPFQEARVLPLKRRFKDDLPAKRDEYGDDIRPRPIEIKGWLKTSLTDSAGGYLEPLQYHLTKGKHTLRFASSDPVVLESITLKPPVQTPDYATVSQQHPKDEPKSKQVISMQAEDMTWKDDVAIQIVADQDPLMVPKANGYERFNALGGDRWQTGGQTAAWSFEVPESGLYRIGMRAYQGFTSNMSVFRQIEIDGKVPFQELAAYRFPYISKWKGDVLGDDSGKPYDIYLEKGTHTISMTATVAPYQDVIIQGVHATDLLRQVDQEIRGMTGGEVDTNRTWKVEEEFPELPKHLEEAKAQLELMADTMLKVNRKRDNTVQTIQTAIQDLDGYLKYPNEIPYHMDDVSGIIERLGGIRDVLAKTPLRLDQLYVIPAGAELPDMEANFWQKLNGTIHNFFYSFTRKRDINNVGDDVLNVWVNRGRDYVNLLQELANESFTPQTGVKVKVNLLPNENLLVLSNAAGIAPDVALGQPQDKSTDFAMRNALLDLSQFPDFKETAQQFAPGAMLPFYYNGGYYALPETQSFKVLYYRKDILSRLKLKVPDTWQDVYDMLPTLQQNGYNFYVPPTDFLTFFYQNGASFYTKDGMQTNMSTPAAFKGFKQWTDLFNIYDLEKSVPNFYQHFRKGDMPIGVADYNQYVTLSVAAPELTGWWGIAPMPGVKQPDGTVARWAAGGESTGFIYKSTKHPKESWEFLKWLVSPETQEQYGSDLESFNGIQFRWNTANIKAFTQLPWPKDDQKVILEQWRWYKDLPNLPGSYFLGRELNNAWNRTVVDGVNDRESLEEAIVNIDREMRRKEQEFGFVDAQGNVLHTLDLPQIDKPWEGVDPYVPK